MFQRQKGPTLASRGSKGRPRTRGVSQRSCHKTKELADDERIANPTSAVIANRSLIVETSTP